MSHTGANIYDMLESVLEEWGIIWETRVCLRDNAANMVAAFNEENNRAGLHSLGCLNHTLQLSINDEIFSLRSVKTLIEKCRSIVGFANSSNKFYAELYRQQEAMTPPIFDRMSLKQDIDTRSVYTCHLLTIGQIALTLSAFSTEQAMPVNH